MNLDEVADAIEQNGTAIMLRRPAPQGLHFDVEVAAMVRLFQANELVGGIQQGDRRIVISNRAIAARAWPGPPKQGDQVIISGKTATLLTNAETVMVGDAVVKHVMQVRGN